MLKRKDDSPVVDVISALFAANDSITSGQVAKVAGVSRQAAHYHLKAMADRGELVHDGAGRGGRYRRSSLLAFHYDRAGLDEGAVWAREFAELQKLDLPILDNPKVHPILVYTFTEMLNNAIEHSQGSSVAVRWFVDAAAIAFEIDDDGIGVFRSMREHRNLASDFDAIGEIAKGKQTTAPLEHSGLGIYFSSRMSSRFSLASGNLSWTVDSRRLDQAVGWLPEERIGTLVRCEVDAATEITQMDVLREFAPPGRAGFNRTRLQVALFDQGEFVSRAEAKRMGAELESFDEVEIDFSGVEQVGQGFVDELFRVWQRDHPGTRLVPLNANPGIAALIAMTIPADDPNTPRAD
jgi:hypothetical protein